MKKRFLLLLSALLLTAGFAGAQNKVALKNNLLGDASLSPNLGLEFALDPHWTLDLSATVNLWESYGKTYKHVIAQPEVRWWSCEAFRGFFVGLHAFGGKASLGNLYDYRWISQKCPNLRESYLQRNLVLGAGIGCGYDFVLSRHWNVEVEAGVGYAFVAGTELQNGKVYSNHSVFDYVGPTKLALNIVYLF